MIFIEIEPGQKYPPLYGIAYRHFDRHVAVCCPLGLNIIVYFLREFYMALKRFPADAYMFNPPEEQKWPDYSSPNVEIERLNQALRSACRDIKMGFTAKQIDMFERKSIDEMVEVYKGHSLYYTH